jgi:plastocyanin
MKQKEENNDKIPNLTKPVMVFLSIAGLLTVGSVLQSTTLIFNPPIAPYIAFAQQRKTPKEIISTVKSLLNQTINEYGNQNFTGAQGLASSAYLDQFEFIEAPLEKHDKALKENTEIMLREQLRQAIKDKSSEQNIEQLINNINSNLDKAESLLANESPIQTIESESTAATATNQTNQTTSSSIASNATEVKIVGDEVKEPYIPGSIIIQSGDKVRWINLDEEVHTVTSGLQSSTDSGKQFDSGLINANQTFEHTFDKPGTYNYYCTVHPIMTGLVNVN